MGREPEAESVSGSTAEVPSKPGPGPRFLPDQRRDLMHKAWDLRARLGMNTRNIGAQLGVHHTTVAEWLKVYRTEIAHEDFETISRMIGDALDTAKMEYSRIISERPGAIREIEALNGYVNVIATQAKLYGVNAPERIHFDAVVTEKTQADLELDELIREAKTRNASAKTDEPTAQQA